MGFDWATPTDILKKLTEEVEEFFDAPEPEERAREFGIFCYSGQQGRRMDIEAEFALRETNTRSAAGLNSWKTYVKNEAWICAR